MGLDSVTKENDEDCTSLDLHGPEFT
jgi:hypothetical protein